MAQTWKKALCSQALHNVLLTVLLILPVQFINAEDVPKTQVESKNSESEVVYPSGSDLPVPVSLKSTKINTNKKTEVKAKKVHPVEEKIAKANSKNSVKKLPVKIEMSEVPASKRSKISSTVTISVRHADLAEVFEMMSKHGRINILLANGVQGEVSINLYEIDLHEAIKAVAIAAGFAVEKSGNTYFVVTRDDAGKEIVDGLTEVRSFKVQYSDPDVVATILSDHLSRYGKITALPERRLVIVEDLPEFIDRIENLLEELDSTPVQILIEAQILEIRLERTETYGVDWQNLFSTGDDIELGVSGLSVPGSGLFFGITNANLKAALGTLSRKGRVRTLSTPKLMVLEHQEAEVIIGDRIGYTEVTLTEGGTSIENVKFLDSGVILRVTPFVDRSGKIMMQIHPEVSSATINAGVPSLQTTEVTTQLLAADGETIFIGGLIKNNTVNERGGVPILSDIPVLGYLFRSQSDTVSNTETVVMITPRIVKPGESLRYPDEQTHKEVIKEIDTAMKKESADIEKIFKNHVPIGKKFSPLSP